MIRTKDLTLDEATKLLDDDVQDLGDLYRSKLIGGDNELMIAFPKQLRMIPGKTAYTPCTAHNDVSGTLATFLGGEYVNSSVSFIVGKYHPASEYDDNIATMEMVYSMQDATYALIFAELPVDHPPVDVSLGSDISQRLKAVFCGHYSSDDLSYDKVFWIVPLDSLTPIRTYIDDRVNYGVVILECIWREYDVRKHYYRQKIEETIRDLGNIVDGIKFNYDADYLIATVPEEARNAVDDALDEPVWYNEDGLNRVKRLGRSASPGFGALFHGLPGGMIVVGIGV